MHRLTLFIKKQMNSNHLLLATLALFLADFLEHVQSSPTLSSVDSFDDVDMSLLRRAMRQGNDCDSQVAYTGKKHLVSFKMMLTNGSSIYLIFFFFTGRSSGTLPALRESDSFNSGVSSLLSATRESSNLVYEVPGLRDQQII